MEPAWKEITSPDGALAFRVPAHCREGQEADGTRPFHDPGADTGVLRVKLFPFTSEQRVTSGVARQQLASMDPAPGQRIEALPSGAIMRSHREEAEAAGERTVIHLWLLAKEDPPHRLRLAVFSLSLPAAGAVDLGTRRVVKDLDREVRAAHIGPRA